MKTTIIIGISGDTLCVAKLESFYHLLFVIRTAL